MLQACAASDSGLLTSTGFAEVVANAMSKENCSITQVEFDTMFQMTDLDGDGCVRMRSSFTYARVNHSAYVYTRYYPTPTW